MVCSLHSRFKLADQVSVLFMVNDWHNQHRPTASLAVRFTKIIKDLSQLIDA